MSDTISVLFAILTSSSQPPNETGTRGFLPFFHMGTWAHGLFKLNTKCRPWGRSSLSKRAEYPKTTVVRVDEPGKEYRAELV